MGPSLRSRAWRIRSLTWRKARFSKTAQPIDHGAHIDMCRLVKIIRRRGEKDAGGRCGHGSDRVQCRRLRHVLEDLDAGHEVVVIGQGSAIEPTSQ